MRVKTIDRIARGTLQMLLHDRPSLKYYRLWLRSHVDGSSTLDEQIPWLSFKAKEWLEAYLRPNFTVFEYGSGGSTLFLARRVKRVESAEHDPAWHAQVVKTLRELGLTNVSCKLIEPEAAAPGATAFSSNAADGKGKSFERYVREIEQFEDGSFDLVIVDGRARAACIRAARPKIRSGGYVLLDDADRRQYQAGIGELADCERTDLRSLGPFSGKLKLTAVWRIP